MDKELKTVITIILVVSAISAFLVLYFAEMNALNSARELNLDALGDNLVTLVLIIVVLAFSAMGIKAIFGNKNSKRGGW